MLKRISIYWVLLVALALTSAVPIVVIAFLEINSAQDEFEEQARQSLEAETRGQAAIYNNELQEFRLTTDIAATQAQKLLTKRPGTEISPAEIDNRLEKYEFIEYEYDDGETEILFGLDDWFYDAYEPRAQDELVSNAFIEEGSNFEQNLGLRYTVAVTERLDSLFGALADSLDRSEVIQRHNIFLITTDGMYRVFPFLPTDYAPYGSFTELPEYVIANSENNPERLPIWSPPIIDPDFDASVFVSNSVPIYGGDDYLGVMVHDLDLSSLEERSNNFSIGDEGEGFIMDADGFIVIHPNYKPTETWQNLSDEVRETFFIAEDLNEWYAQNGLDVQVQEYYPNIESHVEEIIDLETSNGMFEIQHEDQEWVVAYEYLPETDWYFITLQPRSELIETATELSARVQQAGFVMIGIVLVASVLLASRITRPVAQLSDAARLIEDHVDDETADLINEDLRKLGDITSMREIDNLARVFKQMVFALNKRMLELNSVYALGQTITSTIDYEATMEAILNAVRQVVQCDAAEIVIKRGQTLVADAWSGDEAYVSSIGHVYTKDDTPIGEILNNSEIIYLPDVPTEIAFKMESDTAEVKSLLAIPLTRNEKLVGALVLAHRTPGHFTDDMRRQLVKLSPQASIAIENAVQVKEREDALKRQITELKVAIDHESREVQIGEISESDFFKNLQKSAAKLRQRAQTKPIEDKSDEGSDKPKEE